jgi:hypothetical protein
MDSRPHAKRKGYVRAAEVSVVLLTISVMALLIVKGDKAPTLDSASRYVRDAPEHHERRADKSSEIVAKRGSAAAKRDLGATGYRQLIQPAFTPKRLLTARHPAQFATDLAKMRAGDELNVRPMTIRGEFLINKRLSSYAEIHFSRGVVFSGATSRGFYTIAISNASHIRIYGGEVENPVQGACVRINDSTDVLWWHFRLYDCAAGGILGTSIQRSSSGIDFDGEIDHVAYDTSFDPHADKCTGIHGAYLGATYQDAAPTISGRFSLYIRDVPCGAALQAGSNLVNTQLWIKAVDISHKAQANTAGNAIQFWGGDLHSITVHDVTGNYLAGRVVETSGMYSCCDSGIVVQHGRGMNTLQNPLLSRVNFLPNPAVTFLDVASCRDAIVTVRVRPKAGSARNKSGPADLRVPRCARRKGLR